MNNILPIGSALLTFDRKEKRVGETRFDYLTCDKRGLSNKLFIG